MTNTTSSSEVIMRVESVSSLKTLNRKLQKVPAEGTKLRELWDKLHQFKGVACDCSIVYSHSPKSLGIAINQLRDFYGCDIIKTNIRVDPKKRSVGRPKYKYSLIGEWFGLDYHDYLADKINSYDQRLFLEE